jgi:hypothetical protein
MQKMFKKSNVPSKDDGQHIKEEKVNAKYDNDDTEEKSSEMDIMKQQEETDDMINVDTTTSLQSVYGNKFGLIQLVSILLNTILMLYSHIGSSAILVSNHLGFSDLVALNAALMNNTNTTNNTTISTVTDVCTVDDLSIWENGGGRVNRTQWIIYCSALYISNETGATCFVDPICVSQCFNKIYNYTKECSNCFGSISSCSLNSNCAGPCASDPLSMECETCNKPCIEIAENCTGFTVAINNNTNEQQGNASSTTVDIDSSLSNDEVCTQQQQSTSATEYINYDTIMGNRTEFYTLYDLSFFIAIKDIWDTNAKVLAVIVVLFSGCWPYIKSILLLYIWYIPLSTMKRYRILQLLKRVSKFTLIDVFVSKRCTESKNQDDFFLYNFVLLTVIVTMRYISLLLYTSTKLIDCFLLL